MDTIQFQCSGCAKSLSARLDKAGKTAKCPACGTSIQVPDGPCHQPSTPQNSGSEGGHQVVKKTACDGETRVETPLDKIRFACAGCGKSISAPPDKAGQTGKCPSCGKVLQIPQSPDHYKDNLIAACAALGKAFDLQEQGDNERAEKGFELAENWVREVLQTPGVPLPIGVMVKSC
jgi:DNA-directed RNA polymerase subunit RPC12/RpoP